MKKPKAPAFQFYASDWLGSSRVRLMKLDERGAYITLLAISWDEVGFEDNEATIAKLLDLKPGSSKFRRIWDKLRGAFYLEGGRWFNARQERQRVEHTMFCESQRERANKRWGRKRSDDATALPRQSQRSTAPQCSPSPSPTPTPQTPHAKADSGGLGEQQPTPIAEITPKAVPPEASEAWRAVLRGEKPAPRREDVS